MKPKIAILAPEHFNQFLKEMLQFFHIDYKDKCELSFHGFSRLKDIPALYDELCDQYDGFCVAGNFTRKIILETAQEKRKPVQSISARSTEYFKAFFHLLNEKRDTDLSRVIIDTYLWGGEKVPKTVQDFIQTDWLLRDLRDTLLSEISLEQILHIEETVLQNAEKLMKDGQADLILCRQSTSYPFLKEAGIPCSFVYPAADSVIDAISLLIGRIRLQQIEEEMPAVIYITSEALQKDVLSGINSNNLELQKLILEFDQANTAGFVIKQSVNGYEIYTTKQIVKKITEDFTACQLRKFILSRSGMEVQIGYGLGQTVMRARLNALEACTAARHGNESYLMTADGSLIGPLDSRNVLRIAGSMDQNILDAAKKSKLSISTIQRILSVTELLGKKELTTQELSSALQVTVANANRFMNALEKNGFAEILTEKKSYSKGRPSRVYRILLGEAGQSSK